MLQRHCVSCVLLVAFQGISTIELWADQPSGGRDESQVAVSSDEVEKPEPAPRQPDDKLTPAKLLERMFDKLGPPVGSSLPDVTALDADGQPFPLSRLKGNYSVIVFGCLT